MSRRSSWSSSSQSNGVKWQPVPTSASQVPLPPALLSTEPLLAVKIEGTSEVMVGEITSQTLMISNPGTGTAANVTVEAIIPAGLVHAKGDRLQMELGNLAPGESRPVRLALTAESGGRQVIEVHATADSGLVQSAAAEVTVNRFRA